MPVRLTLLQVEYVQPDVRMHAYGLVYQNPATWGLSRVSNILPLNSRYVFDESAGEGTCAYVIDTGIYVDHPDFQGRANHHCPNQMEFANLDRCDLAG